MTSWECYENMWFYMKYTGKYLSGEILLTRECTIKLAGSVYLGWKSKGINSKIKTFEKNCDEISFAKENYKRKKN
jgi:hypothetical protein